MEIIKFIIKRLFYSIFVIIGFSIMIFFFTRAIPGDPARVALGENATEWAVERLREEMYLNEPIHIQYYYWIQGVIKGDFGKSLTSQRDVVKDIRDYFPASFEIALYGGILMIILATLFGTISGWHENSWIDNLFRLVAYLGVVTPSFVFAIIFVLIFSYYLDLLPTIGRLTSGITRPPYITGLISIDALITGNYRAFIDAIKHLILPVISLVIGPMAQIMRIIRSSIVDNLNKDYIMAERSHGIPERVIMFKYLLKPSFIPGISAAGLSFAVLIGNAFLVELIFNWPGLSRYGMNAMLRKDLNSIIAVTIIYALLFIVFNIIVDIAVNILDPRIELTSGRDL
jgi:peptide/nickel transport system permease protein